MSPLLEIERLAVTYAGAWALGGINLAVRPGEAVAILGPNGAGKSSLLKAVIGLTPASAGTILFAGVDLLQRPAHARARLGIGYVPEGRRVFPGMTVRENLEAAARLPPRQRTQAVERVYAVFPQLAGRNNEPAWRLSGGQQQMVAVGRALVLAPRLLLLDEPTLGLAPIVAADLLHALETIRRDTGVAMIVVEQNVAFVQRLCQRSITLKRGRIELDVRHKGLNHVGGSSRIAYA